MRTLQLARPSAIAVATHNPPGFKSGCVGSLMTMATPVSTASTLACGCVDPDLCVVHTDCYLTLLSRDPSYIKYDFTLNPRA